MTSDKETELLPREYFHLQQEIENFDSKSLTIKAWSVSIVGGVAAASSIIEGREIFLLAASISFLFWLIDTSWKTFQYANYKRISAIERAFRGEGETLSVLQMGQSWKDSYKEGGKRRFFKIMFKGYVFLPHGAMTVISILIFYLTRIPS